MTFREFIKQFPDETHCREYLYKLRFPNGYVCPKCEHSEYWKTGEQLYECKKCGRQSSVIAGTIFQDTRKPLMDWFIAIWWVTTQKNGASALGLQNVLGIKSHQTAWTWLHKIRSAMVNPNRTKLSGTVEIDEAYIGGEGEGKRGRGAENKVVVAVACELGETTNKVRDKLGRCRMSVIADVSADSLHGFITENIEVGSQLITDDWTGFSGIEAKGYTRQIYVQKYTDDETKMLPHVHTIVSLLKRWLLGTHQGAVEPNHLQAYLDEYVFRFNRRKSAERGLLFYRLLESAMRTKTTTYKDLTNHNI
jgi:transposase-like protein